MQNFRHWIFDLDGTLTEPIHNFDQIRTTLDVPKGRLILEYIENLDTNKKMNVKQRLVALEKELAMQSKVAQGAKSLLNYLLSMGHDVAVLTRNTRANALLTLQNIDLLSHFQPSLVIGREDTNPKPSKDGIVYLLSEMGGTTSKTVIVGDHRIDLLTGRNSNISTIHVSSDKKETWPTLTDYRFSSLVTILQTLKSGITQKK